MGEQFSVRMIYLWEKEREHYIEQVEVYARQVRIRLFDSFREVEREAQQESEEYLDLFSKNFGEDGDPGEAYEGAYDKYIDYQLGIRDLMRELYLTALSGLYFMWDRQLREFFEREPRYYLMREHAEQEIWHPSALQVLKKMKKFGAEFGDIPNMKRIEKLSLIVNVHKHGKGDSLRKLQSEFGDEFVSVWGSSLNASNLDEKSLFISEEDFFEYSKCL
jgi:hypothetical protein